MRVLLVAALSVLAACHKPEPVVESPTPSVEQERAERAAEVPESMQRHWTFLNPIRQDDAFNICIHRTMLNEENQLGVVLFSSVKLEQVSAVMNKVMSEMAREFPHEDVTHRRDSAPRRAEREDNLHAAVGARFAPPKVSA